MPDFSPHEYRAGATAAGREPAVTERAIRRASAIRQLGCEPVLTLGELAVRTGAHPRYLRELAQRQRDPYTEIRRPKPDGTTRPISSPEPALMDVQRWVLRRILVSAPSHHRSWAYRPGCSIVDCAREHAGARWLIKLDIHDFFGSIDEMTVYETFRALRYPNLISFELARLCTRSSFGAEHGRRHDRKPYLALIPGVLPQGAPTSGALANAAMVDVDASLDKLAEHTGLIYTRYSDDMVFSTRGSLARSQASAVIAQVESVLLRHRLRLHARKTSVVTPRARKVVLGLLLRDDGQVSLTPWFKQRVETHIRGVRVFGLVDHAAHRRFRSVLSLIEHVYGCIAFAHDVEPTLSERMLTDWEEVLRAQGYPAP